MRKTLLILSALVAFNWLVIFGQGLVDWWKYLDKILSAFPEPRYWVESLIVFIPFLPILALRWRHGRKLLAAMSVLLAATAVAYLVKAKIPGTRRYQYLAATDWAVEMIRKDYKGPLMDSERFYTNLEYHRENRPVVEAHTARVAYLLDGRNASEGGAVLIDLPDYIVDEPHRMNTDWFWAAKYDKICERKFGKRVFELYRKAGK